MSGPKILLVIGGGIAAYKSCELVRLIRKAGGDVTCVLTEGGQQFVTPMALAALSENKVYTSLFDLKDEVEMGHIQLSRQADLVVVCPATADLLAKMTAGIADDLATTLILATDKPVIAVPAMNVRMWEHSATQRNADWLRQAGVTVMDPDEGAMACGEFGPGRLPEPPVILQAIAEALDLDIDLPELAAPAPQLAAPAPSAYADDSADEDEYDEEDSSSSGSGLGSLLNAIIPRSTESRGAEDDEQDFDESEFEEPDFDESEFQETEFKPDFGGPLLAKKGGAAAAPPTDREAINHTVARQDERAAPQPMPGDIAHADHGAALSADPLYGQAIFDENPEHRPLYGKHVLVTAGRLASRLIRCATSPTDPAGSRALRLRPWLPLPGPALRWLPGQSICRRRWAWTGSMWKPPRTWRKKYAMRCPPMRPSWLPPWQTGRAAMSPPKR